MREEDICYEDEIDLYGIWDMISKYKKGIIGIVVIGFILSFAAAMVARGFRQEYTEQQYEIYYGELNNNPYYQMANLSYRRFDINSVLQDEKYIDRFLEIPALKELYKEGKNPKMEIFNKREFINKIIILDKAKSGHSRIKVQLDSKLGGADEIISTYFQILKEEIPDKIQSVMAKELVFAKENNKLAEVKLQKIEVELRKHLKSEILQVSSKNDARELVAIEAPILMTERGIYTDLYNRTSKKVVGIRMLEKEPNDILNIVEKEGDLVIEIGKSMAKMVLIAGVFISFSLAFMYVFISEVRLGYRKHREMKDKKSK